MGLDHCLLNQNAKGIMPEYPTVFWTIAKNNYRKIFTRFLVIIF